MTDRSHEHFEILVVKMVDGVASAEERAQLNDHLVDCADCRAELADFSLIKETTDAMTERILRSATIEPPRASTGARRVVSASFALLLAGALLLLGFAAYALFGDAAVPAVVKAGAALAGMGALGLLGYALSVRTRARGKDPYEEIDR